MNGWKTWMAVNVAVVGVLGPVSALAQSGDGLGQAAGFSGKVSGVVEKVADRGVVFRVARVLEVWDGNRADNPEALNGRVIRITPRTEGVEPEQTRMHAMFLRHVDPGAALTLEVVNPSGNQFHILELNQDQRARVRQAAIRAREQVARPEAGAEAVRRERMARASREQAVRRPAVLPPGPRAQEPAVREFEERLRRQSDERARMEQAMVEQRRRMEEEVHVRDQRIREMEEHFQHERERMEQEHRALAERMEQAVHERTEAMEHAFRERAEEMESAFAERAEAREREIEEREVHEVEWEEHRDHAEARHDRDEDEYHESGEWADGREHIERLEQELVRREQLIDVLRQEVHRLHREMAEIRFDHERRDRADRPL